MEDAVPGLDLDSGGLVTAGLEEDEAEGWSLLVVDPLPSSDLEGRVTTALEESVAVLRGLVRADPSPGPGWEGGTSAALTPATDSDGAVLGLDEVVG